MVYERGVYTARQVMLQVCPADLRNKNKSELPPIRSARNKNSSLFFGTRYLTFRQRTRGLCTHPSLCTFACMIYPSLCTPHCPDFRACFKIQAFRLSAWYFGTWSSLLSSRYSGGGGSVITSFYRKTGTTRGSRAFPLNRSVVT